MPARLPVDQSDNNSWGPILNEFLEVVHNSDGTTKDSSRAGAKEFRLVGATAEGDTTFVLNRAPGYLTGQGWLVLDPWTTSCEILLPTTISGTTVTCATPSSATLTATNIGFVAATKRISGSLQAIGKFFPGEKILISGSVSNNGTYTIADYPNDGSYDGTYITTVEALVDETAGASVTIVRKTKAHSDGAVVMWTDGTVPVTWYGARASGSTAHATANRLAIQRCFNDAYYAQFWDVYLPGFGAGRYFIDGPVYLEKNTHLRGPNQKSAVLAAAPTFATWDDDSSILQSRLSGRITRLADAGADRYFVSGIGIDGQGVAYAKNTNYSATNDWNGTAYVQSGTNTVSIHATLTVGGTTGANNRIVYRALAAGTGGNSIRVAHVNDGASQPLTVTVSGNDITVHLATNGASAITSTANDVVAAVNADAPASALVQATLGYAGISKPNAAGDAIVALNEGTAVVTAFALTAFEAGTAPFASGDVGRSIYLGMRQGARDIATFVDSSTVTVTGAAFTGSRAGLSFVVSPVNGMSMSCNQTCIFQDIRIEGCPGFGAAFVDCQEFSVRNLMTFNCGIHRRLVGVQFAHFEDCNMERTSDAYVTFEGILCRSIDFHNGHIEDISACDFWRTDGTGVVEGLTFGGSWQATCFHGSRTLRVESTTTSSPTFAFVDFMWSGPNSGVYLISDDKRGYYVPMTDFASGNNFSCDHLFMRNGIFTSSRNVVSKTAAYTMRPMDRLVKADATSGAFTVTLPPATAIRGTEFTVKRMNSGANAVTLDTAGAETFDGAASITLSAQYDRATVMSDGTNYVRVD